MAPQDDISSIDGRQSAAHEAARWLAALSDERCTDAERDSFFQWLRASTQHVDEFLRVSTIARRATNRSLWPQDSVETLVAAAASSANVEPLASAASAPMPRRRRQIGWAIAASALAAVGVGALLATQPQLRAYFEPAYATAIGEQRSITLADGSVIELNSASKVRARYSKALRAITLLEGEAIFRVAKDPGRPFRVRTGATDIIAVGTAFNVDARDAHTIVTVLEGRVRVQDRNEAGSRAADEHVELAMGEQLIVSGAAPAIRIALRDTEKVTSWTQRRLIFEDTTIGDAAREFARYSERAIRIDDAELASRKINGVFDAGDPASLVQFLEATDATVRVTMDGDDWVVSQE